MTHHGKRHQTCQESRHESGNTGIIDVTAMHLFLQRLHQFSRRIEVPDQPATSPNVISVITTCGLDRKGSLKHQGRWSVAKVTHALSHYKSLKQQQQQISKSEIGHKSSLEGQLASSKRWDACKHQSPQIDLAPRKHGHLTKSHPADKQSTKDNN